MPNLGMDIRAAKSMVHNGVSLDEQALLNLLTEVIPKLKLVKVCVDQDYTSLKLSRTLDIAAQELKSFEEQTIINRRSR